MKILILLSVLSSLILPAFPLQGATGGAGRERCFARVAQVYAGDRIMIIHRGQRRHIRVHGIFIPPGAAGLEARQFTRQMAKSRSVHVRFLRPDRRGSEYAEVYFLGGKSLARELVRAGLARWSRKQAPDDQQLALLEKEARERRRGIWSELLS